MMSLVFLNMLINQDFTLGYLYIIMLLIFSFITSEIISFNDFVEASIKVIYFLTIYALLCYLLSPIIFANKSLFPTFVNAADLKLIHLGFAVLVDIEGYYRLFGLFRESGVFQIFLNIAIIMELFLRKGKVRLQYLTVLFIGLILTFSTPGYIAAVMTLLSYFFFNKKKKDKKDKKAFLGGGGLLVILIIILYTSNPTISSGIDNTWNKFYNKESSYMGRTTSIGVELDLWTERPLFGHGIQRGFELSKQSGAEVLGSYMFNTSTITGLLVTLGAVFTFILLLMLINFSFRLEAKFLGILLITIGIVIMISSQLMMYNAYFYALLFISLRNPKFGNG